MTPDDRDRIEAFAQRIADEHVCGATIRYDHGRPETKAIRCERTQGHAGVHFNDRAAVIWSAL